MVSLGDAVHRPRLIENVFRSDIRGRIGVEGPLMLDSGGFTMMMNDRSLKLPEIAAIYCDTQAELCITLDVPPIASDSARKRSGKYRRTRNNLSALIELVGGDRIVPVVHGINIAEVDANCQAISELLPRPKMVCVGGLVPMLRRSGRPSAQKKQAVFWLGNLIESVRASFPRSIIHVLGAGSPLNVAMTIMCGADSTDSLAWRRAAGFGTIYLPGTSERFLSPRNRQRENSRPTLNQRELGLLEVCSCAACAEWPDLQMRVTGLATSYLARAAHNASVVLAAAAAQQENRV